MKHLNINFFNFFPSIRPKGDAPNLTYIMKKLKNVHINRPRGGGPMSDLGTEPYFDSAMVEPQFQPIFTILCYIFL